MHSCEIATIPADGIGPEVMDAGLKVLEALRLCESGNRFEAEHVVWGPDDDKSLNGAMQAGGLDRHKGKYAMINNIRGSNI